MFVSAGKLPAGLEQRSESGRSRPRGPAISRCLLVVTTLTRKVSKQQHQHETSGGEPAHNLTSGRVGVRAAGPRAQGF